MTFADFNAHTDPIFSKLGLLKVRDVIKAEQVKIAYKYHIDELPEQLMSLFSLRSEIGDRILGRNRDHFLYLSNFRTMNFGKRSIRYHCSKLWNLTLGKGIIVAPKKIVTFKDVKSFAHLKYVLKKHFLLLFIIIVNYYNFNLIPQ